MMQDEFVVKVLSKVRDIKERDAHLASTERGIAEQRASLARELIRLDEALKTYAEVMRLPAVQLTDADATAQDLSDEFGVDLRTLTVADGADRVLRRLDGRARATLIVEILTRAGKLRGESVNANYATVVQALDRDPRFRKVKPGVWALVAVADDEPPLAQSVSVPVHIPPPGYPPGGHARQTILGTSPQPLPPPPTAQADRLGVLPRDDGEAGWTPMSTAADRIVEREAG